MIITFIFSILILLFSVVIHEVSHGYAANALGDPTAKYQGRLTLNPLSHIDPVGSIIIPAVGFLLGGFVFGWAKPVPYNPYNLRYGRWGELLVALSGPVSNIAIVLIFGLGLRFFIGSMSVAASTILSYIIVINLILALFNLIPIPPLDGSKILFALLPQRFIHIRYRLEQYGFVLVIIFVVLLSTYFGGFVTNFIQFVFVIVTGLHGVSLL